MPIRGPLPQDTRSRLADWLEVMALTTSRGVATRADVVRLYDRLADDGHDVQYDPSNGDRLESEILEDDRHQAADVVLDELEHRRAVVSSYYPFEIRSRGPDWSIRRVSSRERESNESSVGQECYIFCLLTSAIRDRRIQGPGIPDLERAMARHFQEIASEAAADVIGGVSVSFGWPRKEGTAFRPALQDLNRQLRLGTVHDSVPIWSNGREKDSGIDVVAWREFDDKRPGKLVLFGQVASGNDWTQKSVKLDTPRFLSWFSQQPTHHYIPAIFIPFPQHHECDGRSDAAFEDVASAQAWLREQEFGLVIDRLRIVGAAARQLTSTASPSGSEMLTAVKEWIVSALNEAKSVA
jgi:hypothetical protein